MNEENVRCGYRLLGRLCSKTLRRTGFVGLRHPAGTRLRPRPRPRSRCPSSTGSTRRGARRHRGARACRNGGSANPLPGGVEASTCLLNAGDQPLAVARSSPCGRKMKPKRFETLGSTMPYQPVQMGVHAGQFFHVTSLRQSRNALADALEPNAG